MRSSSVSYERMGIKTRFEKEAKSNSEMAYLDTLINNEPMLKLILLGQ